MQYGYFTQANQDVPEYDPGLNINCPICNQLLSTPMKTISVMLEDDSRSFFYRVHKPCYENLSEEEVKKLDSLVVDVRAMQNVIRLTQRTPDGDITCPQCGHVHNNRYCPKCSFGYS